MRIYVAACLALATLPLIVNGAEKKPEEKGLPSKAQPYQFKDPVRIEAGEEVVSVESPGYACPTMADVDGDGKQDLVVGQFRNGNMQFCRNIADASEPPRFAAAEWLKLDGERLEVPGVW